MPDGTGPITLEISFMAREYTNLAAILPSVYAENAQVPDHIEDFR